MTAAKKNGARKPRAKSAPAARPIKSDVVCHGMMRIFDPNERVSITRDLNADDNGIGCPDEWDPMLQVGFYPLPSELHPGDPHPSGEQVENVRASELRKLADQLNAAINLAEMLNVIPPRLTDEQWRKRYAEAQGLKA